MLISTMLAIDSMDGGREAIGKFAARAPPHTVVSADPLHDRRTVPVRSLRQCPPLGPFRAHLLEELALLHVGNALLRPPHWCLLSEQSRRRPDASPNI